MSDAVLVRELAAPDRATVVALVAQLQEAERLLDPRLPPGAGMAERYVLELETQRERWDGRFLVAERSGRVVGFVSVFVHVPFESADDPKGSFALIGDLVVDRAHRGEGIGGRLLAEAERHAAGSGAVELRVSVLAGNHEAERLYDAAGLFPYLVTRRKLIRTHGASGGGEGEEASPL